MHTYKTEMPVVNVNAFSTTLFGHSTKNYKEDDIIIASAVWNQIVESFSHDLPGFVGQTGSGKSQVRS